MWMEMYRQVWKLRVSPIEKLLLLAYIKYLRAEKTVCWPSQKALQAMTGLSRSSIYRAKCSLEANSLISVVPQVGRKVDIIQVNYPFPRAMMRTLHKQKKHIDAEEPVDNGRVVPVTARTESVKKTENGVTNSVTLTHEGSTQTHACVIETHHCLTETHDGVTVTHGSNNNRSIEGTTERKKKSGGFKDPQDNDRGKVRNLSYEAGEQEEAMKKNPFRGMSAEEIVAAKEALKPEPPKKLTQVSLPRYWVQLYRLSDPSSVILPITKREGIALSRKVKQTGAEGVTEAMERVMVDWAGFIDECKSKYGAFPLPTAPNFMFFVRYLEAALNFSKPLTKTPKHGINESKVGKTNTGKVQMYDKDSKDDSAEAITDDDKVNQLKELDESLDNW